VSLGGGATEAARTAPAGVAIGSADLSHPLHAEGLLDILDAYAREEVGGSMPLSADVRARLIPALCAEPGAEILLALFDGAPVGAAVCFRSFSTFAARPSLNLHDLAVLPEHRGKGLGRALLHAVEARARALGCCKVTLEVADVNARARALYRSAGFENGAPGLERFAMWFLEKKLT
jgi:ribosomal protein S18 acetylase RimI-like enzyme